MEYSLGVEPESPTARSLPEGRLLDDVMELILSHLTAHADRRRRQQLLNDGLTNMPIADDFADNLLVVQTSLTTTTCSRRRARTRRMTATTIAGARAEIEVVDAGPRGTGRLPVHPLKTSTGAGGGR